MSKIVFFSIPAHGHTNPTLNIVKELVYKGHEVVYYSFNEFKEKIENTGARFISCDQYLPESKPSHHILAFEAMIELATNMGRSILEKLKIYEPDCIVADLFAFWGKFYAEELGTPYICSTTTFMLTSSTRKQMKLKLKEMFSLFKLSRSLFKKQKTLKDIGFRIRSIRQLVENDVNDHTLVYTSKEIHPESNSFPDNILFVGPTFDSSKENGGLTKKANKKLKIYISMGTINNRQNQFYNNCFEALKDYDAEIIMSIGKSTDISSLGHIPNNFIVKNHVDQLEVLKHTDIFITHSGMNSVHEGLYYGVPLILFPQQSEQNMVANRIVELSAGIILKDNKPTSIMNVIECVNKDATYKTNALKLSKDLRKAGGVQKAAQEILKAIK